MSQEDNLQVLRRSPRRDLAIVRRNECTAFVSAQGKGRIPRLVSGFILRQPSAPPWFYVGAYAFFLIGLAARNKAYKVGQAPTHMVIIETIQLTVAEFLSISVAAQGHSQYTGSSYTASDLHVFGQISMYLAKQMTMSAERRARKGDCSCKPSDLHSLFRFWYGSPKRRLLISSSNPDRGLASAQR